MAKPTTLRWSKLSIWVGDGGSPEDFTSQVCGMNAKGMAFSADMSESSVPDCDDPDAPSWMERVTRSLSAGVSGEGLLAEETFAFWRDWFLAATAKNVRVVVDLATLPGYFQGSFVLNQFELNGAEADGKLGITVAMSSDGPVTWVAGAP